MGDRDTTSGIRYGPLPGVDGLGPVFEMTYTVSSGTLNSSIPYHCPKRYSSVKFLLKGNANSTSWSGVIRFNPYSGSGLWIIPDLDHSKSYLSPGSCQPRKSDRK